MWAMKEILLGAVKGVVLGAEWKVVPKDKIRPDVRGSKGGCVVGYKGGGTMDNRETGGKGSVQDGNEKDDNVVGNDYELSFYDGEDEEWVVKGGAQSDDRGS